MTSVVFPCEAGNKVITRVDGEGSVERVQVKSCV